MKIDIYKDGTGYLTDEVSSIPTNEANLNEENRVKFVTDLAAVSRGKDSSNNPPKRYQQLLKEAALKTPSRPLEFLPVVLDVFNDNGVFSLWDTSGNGGDENFVHEFIDIIEAQKLFAHSYIDKSPFDDGTNQLTRCYTNMRALLNAGVPYERIIYNTKEELQDFVALKAKIPMFVFNHFVTHTAISKEALSDRVTLQSGEYWLPKDLREKVHSKLKDTRGLTFYEIFAMEKILSFRDKSMVSKYLANELSQMDTQQLLKDLGYKPEIYQRAMLEFRYKTVVMTGWNNNPKTFKHFMIEREAYPELHKSWVQKETRQLAEAMRKIIGK